MFPKRISKCRFERRPDRSDVGDGQFGADVGGHVGFHVFAVAVREDNARDSGAVRAEKFPEEGE